MKRRTLALLKRARIAGLKARIAKLEADRALLTEQRDGNASRLAEYENALGWGVSCTNCAHLLDGSIAETFRAEAAEEMIRRYEDLLDSVELYIKWRWVTGQLTTEQRELFADALDHEAARTHGPDGEDPDPELAVRGRGRRWWSPDYIEPMTVGHCSACGGTLERGVSGAWWHVGETCGRNDAHFVEGRT